MTELQHPTLEPEDASAPSEETTGDLDATAGMAATDGLAAPDESAMDSIGDVGADPDADAVTPDGGDAADFSDDDPVESVIMVEEAIRTDDPTPAEAAEAAEQAAAADAAVAAAAPTPRPAGGEDEPAGDVATAEDLAAALEPNLLDEADEADEADQADEADEIPPPDAAQEFPERDEAATTVEFPAQDDGTPSDDASPSDGESAQGTGGVEPTAAGLQAPPATVAALVARQFRAAGVRFAFTVPGESFLALLEAFSDEGIRVVSTRHEGAAAFMAEAYGQLTGRPAVAIGTRAVGAANMSIGIHTARQDSSPMLVVVGQVQRRVRGREAFQEVDQVQSFGRLAKWATEVSDRNAVTGAIDEVIRHLRTGRPGPILLSVPEDLLDEAVPATAPSPLRGRSPDLEPSAVRSVLHLLAGAQRPVILAGAGVLRARATNDLVQFAEMLEVPVIASWRRPDVFPNQHRMYLGMAGLGSASTVQARLRAADAILVLGSRLNEVTTYDYAIPTRSQKWAHVDLEPRAASHGLAAPTISVAGDARSFLRSAIERLKGGVLEAASVDARATVNREDREAFEAASVVDAQPWDGPGVHPGRVVATLNEVLPPDTILTTDAGNFASWAARGYRFRRPATFIGPTSGAMGYGLPAAIAAALARPNRPAVALAGDGGFAMTMAELETAVRERARVVAIVFDNERYGTIRAHQERRGKGTLGTDLGPIDFAAAAQAFGARGVRVETDDDFAPALREALAHSGPTVLHLALDRRWLTIDRVLES